MMHPASLERYIGTLSALRLPATDELNSLNRDQAATSCCDSQATRSQQNRLSD